MTAQVSIVLSQARNALLIPSGALIQRSASKAGRPVREAQWIAPEADFPSLDDNPPLKTLLLRV